MTYQELEEKAYTAEERERLLEEREKRAKKYGIRPQEGRPLTPPAGYPEDPELYGDPVNYAYPIDEEHIRAAIAYFNHEGQREAGGYSEREWEIIGERIAEAATKLLGRKYEYRNGKVVRVEEEEEEKEEKKSARLKVLYEDGNNVFVGGYAVVFGGKDLEGDTFTPKTDFGLSERHGPIPVFYEHGLDPRLGTTKLGEAYLYPDEYGLWVVAQLNRSKEYQKLIKPLIEAGVLGWSTGAPADEVKRDEENPNIITRWPIAEVSLTPRPAEPRTLGVKELKSLIDSHPLKEEEGEKQISVEGGGTMEETIRKIVEEVVANLTPAKSVGFAAPEPEMNAVKAFHLWLHRNETPAVLKTMREGAGAEGGYLVPTELYHELVKALTEESIIRRAGATVIQVSSARVEVPTLSGYTAAVLTAEEGAYSEAEPTIGQVVFTPFKFTRLTRVSEELLADAAFDVWKQVLHPYFVRAFALAENYYFTVGTGSNQPQGVVTAAPVGKTAASTSAITADDIIDLYHSLNHLYREKAVWMMHDQTAAVIRKLKDSTGQYIWQPGLAAGQPDTLLGRPVITNNFMPTIAAGAKVIIFGDFRYYWVVERAGMEIKRLDELYAATGHIGFAAYMRVDGRVVLPEAFTSLRMATA